MLAVKVSREGDTSLCCLLSRVQDVFNLLDATLLSRIEHQLLEVLSSQPAPIAPEPRPRISLPHSLCANAVQVLKWRMPMDAEQHEVYADALFGAAADALLAPPMQDEN